jgi:hypothetical protein
LRDNPTYEKALRRRASANEAMNTWSSLTAAQEGRYRLNRFISVFIPSRLQDAEGAPDFAGTEGGS